MARGPAPAAPAAGAALSLLPWPQVDFAKFGPVETVQLPRIKKISGPALHRNWVDDPARHQPRRRGHHRPRSIPRAAQQGEREVRRQADDARVPDQGVRCRAEEVPGLQQLARGRRCVDHRQEVLAHRLRRRHAGRTRRAGGQGRRPEGHLRHRQGDLRSREARARRQAEAWRHAGRHVLDLAASAASAAPTSRRSSTRPRWRSSACAARRRARCGTGSSSRRGSSCRCRSRGTIASSTVRRPRGSTRIWRSSSPISAG